MKNTIHGDVHHIPNKNTANKFLIFGPHYADGQRTAGERHLGFGLIDETRVEPLIAALPRISGAVAEWEEGQMQGLLRLVLRPPASEQEARADAQDGGGSQRTIHVKDMVRDLRQDKSVSQSRTRTPPNQTTGGASAVNPEDNRNVRYNPRRIDDYPQPGM